MIGEGREDERGLRGRVSVRRFESGSEQQQQKGKKNGEREAAAALGLETAFRSVSTIQTPSLPPNRTANCRFAFNSEAQQVNAVVTVVFIKNRIGGRFILCVYFCF